MKLSELTSLNSFPISRFESRDSFEKVEFNEVEIVMGPLMIRFLANFTICRRSDI